MDTKKTVYKTINTKKKEVSHTITSSLIAEMSFETSQSAKFLGANHAVVVLVLDAVDVVLVLGDAVLCQLLAQHATQKLWNVVVADVVIEVFLGWLSLLADHADEEVFRGKRFVDVLIELFDSPEAQQTPVALVLLLLQLRASGHLPVPVEVNQVEVDQVHVFGKSRNLIWGFPFRVSPGRAGPSLGRSFSFLRI